MTNNVNPNVTQENVIDALEYNNQNDIINQLYEDLLDNYAFLSRLNGVIIIKK